MAYYCGECKVWRGSSDEDRYGRRWCSYSRRYEESNQQTYGCPGFVYTDRAVLTAVSETLQLPPCAMFAAFDAAKEHLVAQQRFDLLTRYSDIGPTLAQHLRTDADRMHIASTLLHDYIQPAMSDCNAGCYDKAIDTYRSMVHRLMKRYHLA